MTEAEKLLNRQIANTEHTVRGGKFNPFNGRRLPRPDRKPKVDKTGLDILPWHKGA